VNVALIGAGRIGHLHARLLSETSGIDTLTVADALADRAAEVASMVGARTAPIGEAIEQADAVVIAAATDAHAELIVRSIEAGKPTFCEKPLAADLEATLDVARRIQSSGVPFQLGFQRRFDAGYTEAKRRLDSGELGTLYVARLAGHDPAPPHEAYIPASGGLFRDFSIHDFDVIRWLTSQEVGEVWAIGSVRGFPVFAKYGDVDTAAATLQLADGTPVVMTVARHDPLGYDIRSELFGSKDSISVGLGPRTPIHSVEPGVEPFAGPAWPDFMDRFEAAYRAEFGAFLQVAAGRRPSPCTAHDGVEALRIAEAATLSLHEHRPVPLAEIPA
jgi:myo-inositol 2-dehydrogenase / D-chiro-inositol 1-dehydrogenase